VEELNFISSKIIKLYENDEKHWATAISVEPTDRSRYWLYIIQSGDYGPVKVGITKDPDKRLKALQTANSEELRLIGINLLPSKSLKDALEIEKNVHDILREHRMAGEWFQYEKKVIRMVKVSQRYGHFYDIKEGDL
jgi:Meiotically Up-regulated Gene 113 (MUG113) protein